MDDGGGHEPLKEMINWVNPCENEGLNHDRIVEQNELRNTNAWHINKMTL